MKAIIKKQHPLWADLPTIFDDFFYEWNTGSAMNCNNPAVNVKETEMGYRLELAAPGLTKDDFKIELNNEVLTISSEKQMVIDEKEGKYTRKEFTYAPFKRIFTLPKDSIDTEHIDANYKGGILNLSLPKKTELKESPIRIIGIS